jgi:hypothetical protein
MNDRILREVIAKFRLVTEFRIYHHHHHRKAICACKYICAVTRKDLTNFAEFDTVILTSEHHNLIR